MCVCVYVCVRACVRACTCVCACACVCLKSPTELTDSNKEYLDRVYSHHHDTDYSYHKNSADLHSSGTPLLLTYCDAEYSFDKNVFCIRLTRMFVNSVSE